ncbi:TPA: hypothetical protein SMP81_002668 [Proteus mirabilis]|uniref:hypothetical protein n=1 Tax=Proteus TaxID=583 RepID=UPI000665FE48|nr:MULTISPECIES: hypothetical protein [Proteus]MCT0080773.1 hypothetical protein [Proteus mirabilis]MCT8196118.1 hypothetical protein [Proteus mirabilis]MDF7209449.1 hypothetical protein [Proteus mirabilis]MDM3587469.1 hypothetical protein [Proteus mirabilis]MDM3818848.1 hypothetical protein [Proteus mirabilis]
MDIKIDIAPNELYQVIENKDGVVTYFANRDRIRELIADKEKQTILAESQGIDRMMFNNDYMDKFNLLIVNEPVEAQANIYEVFAQELEIITNRINKETESIILETEKMNKNAENIGKVIGAVLLGCATFFILYMINN